MKGTKKRSRTARDEGRIGEFLDYLRAECGLAANTVIAYRLDLLRLADFLRTKPPGAATREQILDFVAAEHKKFSPATVARRIAALKMFYRYLRTEDPRRKDPSAILDRPAMWQRLPKVISPTGVRALLDAPRKELARFQGRRTRHRRALFLRDAALLETLYATGCRASEVSDLTVEGVNLEIGYLRCRGKGSRERLVPLGSKARGAIEAYLDRGRPRLAGERTPPHLFLSRSGGRLDRTNVWRITKHYLKVAGLSAHASTHTLRHSFATHMLQGGAGLRAIQEMLGHASPVTTQIYTHLDRREILEAHRKYHPRG